MRLPFFLALPPFFPRRALSVLLCGQCRFNPQFCFSSRIKGDAFALRGAGGSGMGTSGHTPQGEDSRRGSSRGRGQGAAATSGQELSSSTGPLSWGVLWRR